MNGKIVLAIPRFDGSKFGGVHTNILSLATYLIAQGHEAHVIDLNNPDLGLADVIELLREVQPPVVGITSTSPSHLAACDLARAVKRCSEDILVVKGGKHDTFAWETTLRSHPEIDIAVVGEGELILSELLAAVARGADYRHIRGIAYREGGAVRHNPGAPEVDFQALPFPHRSLVPHHESYNFGIFGGKQMAQVMTTRGCPYTCSFCHVGQRYRARTVGQVLEELHYLQNLGYSAVYFDDGTFTASKKRAAAIAAGMIEQGLRLEWGCQTRADRVDAETLETMRRAGCSYIFYGIESADQDILDRMHKQMRVEHSRAAIALTKSLGIRTAVSLMTGTPYEQDRQLMKSFAFVRELGVDLVSLSLYALYPPAVEGSVYEVENDRDPRLHCFDEGFGSAHYVRPERAGQIYEMAKSVLGDAIL
jgi:radical SAM superfamily enzyme YgiQ (UPF0313 family)